MTAWNKANIFLLANRALNVVNYKHNRELISRSCSPKILKFALERIYVKNKKKTTNKSLFQSKLWEILPLLTEIGTFTPASWASVNSI